MPSIDLSILNQRQTPAFYADILANRPAAGFLGRIFVSTNTFAFFRDNGTGWDLIGGPGTGTVTGSGAANQIAFWSGASVITGENELYWDSALNHLGVNTTTPAHPVDISGDQNRILSINQTNPTNDTEMVFKSGGTALWRLGNLYNSAANDFILFDVIGSIQPITVKKTTGQVLIGTSTVGSGKLVVASATGDNGVQIVGASAPSLRIDNAESGPTKRAGLGISTAVNNFIQGSADRDFCIFNGSTTASPILFGIYDTTNVQEAARISAARNFLIGTTTDNGSKLQINGNLWATGTSQSYIAGNLGIGALSANYKVTSDGSGNDFMYAALSTNIGTAGNWVGCLYGYTGTTYQKGATIFESIDGNGRGYFHIALNNAANSSNVTIADRKLTIKPDGVINMPNLPTSAVGLVSGDLWNNLGIVNIVP
jgi:hypothetical protein